MLENLSAAAYGIVAFAIVVVVGTVVLFNLGNGVGGTANTSAQYTVTQLGSTSGGLTSYLPAIIALTVGMLFLGWFGFGKKD